MTGQPGGRLWAHVTLLQSGIILHCDDRHARSDQLASGLQPAVTRSTGWKLARDPGHSRCSEATIRHEKTKLLQSNTSIKHTSKIIRLLTILHFHWLKCRFIYFFSALSIRIKFLQLKTQGRAHCSKYTNLLLGNTQLDNWSNQTS